MIRVLIVDDNKAKVEAIYQMLIDECALESRFVKVVNSVHSARLALRNEIYDLLLLDMVLPNKDNEEPQPDEGANFIDEIYTNPAIKQPNQIIGLTQFEDTFDNLKKRFEDKLWYLVHYKQNDNSWKNRIKNKVYHLIRNKQQIEESIINANKYDIGIICALQTELDMLKSSFERKWERVRVQNFPIDIFTTTITSGYGNIYKICAVSPCNAGVLPTSVLSVLMYNVLKIDYLFMTGITAGFKYDDLQLGDIVVSKSVEDYAVGKIVENELNELQLLKELRSIPADDDLLTKACSLADDFEMMGLLNTFVSKTIRTQTSIKAKAYPSVCGPFVMAAKKAVDEIKKADRKFSALDMEGFGLYYTSHFLKKKCLWIKSISDFADQHKGDDYQNRCALSSGRFLYLLIKEYM